MDLCVDLEQVKLLVLLYSEAVRFFPGTAFQSSDASQGSSDETAQPAPSDSGVESVDDSSFQTAKKGLKLYFFSLYLLI